METTKLALNGHNVGELQLYTDGVKAGKMDLAIKDGILTVYHTEVDEAFAGRGFAKILLEKVVSHAREQQLMIAPLCPYVHAQFRRHAEAYEDVWHKGSV